MLQHRLDLLFCSAGVFWLQIGRVPANPADLGPYHARHFPPQQTIRAIQLVKFEPQALMRIQPFEQPPQTPAIQVD